MPGMRNGSKKDGQSFDLTSPKRPTILPITSLYFMHYNYCKIHQTIRVTPAMEAGLTDHVWEIEELLALIG
jgi:hypothetical protein